MIRFDGNGYGFQMVAPDIMPDFWQRQKRTRHQDQVQRYHHP